MLPIEASFPSATFQLYISQSAYCDASYFVPVKRSATKQTMVFVRAGFPLKFEVHRPPHTYRSHSAFARRVLTPLSVCRANFDGCCLEIGALTLSFVRGLIRLSSRGPNAPGCWGAKIGVPTFCVASVLTPLTRSLCRSKRRTPTTYKTTPLLKTGMFSSPSPLAELPKGRAIALAGNDPA
jgi:hypothetical protein